MNNDYETDLITLIDDDGKEHEFEIIDEIDTDKGHFMALVPTAQNPENLAAEQDTYYIFEVVDDDGEEQLMEVEDEELSDELSDIFESRFDDEYYGEEETEGEDK